MMQKIIDKLNDEYAFVQGEDYLHFVNSTGDIPIVEIKNQYASAKISLQGAHILSWKPAGEDEVIWLSEDASYARGKSIRGGIPLCWPWFGAHETRADLPAHGFARTVLWQVLDTKQLNTGETTITFQLDTTTLSINTEEMWPQATVATYRIIVGKTLSLELATKNNSSQSYTLGQALHTYFDVQDIAEVSIVGLNGRPYLDKTLDFSKHTQTESLTIQGEVDRIYLDTPDEVLIKNKSRTIIIEKTGSLSTVVWNPGEEVAKKMGDLGQDGYQQMLCVESANAAEDTVIVEPEQTHKLNVIYKIQHA